MEQTKRLLKGKDLSNVMIYKGILYEINRTFFHPIGLEASLNSAGELEIHQFSHAYEAVFEKTEPMSTQAFRGYANDKHKERQQYLGFLIQTKDMLGISQVEAPINSPRNIRLDALLRVIDEIAHRCRVRMMEKSDELDSKFTELIKPDDLFLRIRDNLSRGDNIDAINLIAMLDHIQELNDQIKEIVLNHGDQAAIEKIKSDGESTQKKVDKFKQTHK